MVRLCARAFGFHHFFYLLVMITINNLKKIYSGTTVLSIDDLNIGRGEILGLVGNNGAGKTTLFRLMLDLIKADEGTVTYAFEGDEQKDINPAESEEWKRHTGSFVDSGFLIDFLTPEEFLYFIGKLNGLSRQIVDERLEEFQGFMNGEIMGHKKLIRSLSAGNKQKVGIIAAMIARPELIVLDEPFNFLDPSSQNLLKKLLRKYNEETNCTILISSHNLLHTIDISTRVTLLEKGVIIKDLDNTDMKAKQELEDYFMQ